MEQEIAVPRELHFRGSGDRIPIDKVVPAPGFEPGPSEEEQILSLLRLPFRQAGTASVPPPRRSRQGGWRAPHGTLFSGP